MGDPKKNTCINLENEVYDLRRALSCVEKKVSALENIILFNSQYQNDLDHKKFRWFYSALYEPWWTNNFYELESNEKMFWRWVGPDPFLKFTVNTNLLKKYSIVIEISHVIGQEVYQEFYINIDGNKVPINFQNSPCGTKCVAGFQPLSEQCEIIIGSAISGKPTGDTRNLSFALQSIEIIEDEGAYV